MPQSLSKLYVHLVFHVKTSGCPVQKRHIPELSAYMATILKDNDSVPLQVNGTENHMHVFFVLSKNIALAKVVEEVKRHSSRWIKTKGDRYKTFAWQGGYGAFSVSSSMVQKTKVYIKNQEEHHKKLSFQEEYRLFLDEYGLEYKAEYLWNG